MSDQWTFLQPIDVNDDFRWEAEVADWDESAPEDYDGAQAVGAEDGSGHQPCGPPGEPQSPGGAAEPLTADGDDEPSRVADAGQNQQEREEDYAGAEERREEFRARVRDLVSQYVAPLD